MIAIIGAARGHNHESVEQIIFLLLLRMAPVHRRELTDINVDAVPSLDQSLFLSLSSLCTRIIADEETREVIRVESVIGVLHKRV